MYKCVQVYISTHIATHCNTLHHTAPHCITLHHTASHCNTLQHLCIFVSKNISNMHYTWLTHEYERCDSKIYTIQKIKYTLQHIHYTKNKTYTATHYNSMRHTATHWKYTLYIKVQKCWDLFCTLHRNESGFMCEWKKPKIISNSWISHSTDMGWLRLVGSLKL